MRLPGAHAPLPQWSARTSDALAGLRSLLRNDGWNGYWLERQARRLAVAT